MHTHFGPAIIADQNEIFRAGFRAFLRSSFSFETVLEASSDAEMFRLARETSDVSLLCVDRDLPGIDSESGLASLRYARPTLKIAVVSGSLDRRDVISVISAGLHGYISKDLSTDAVRRAIQMILDGHIFVPPSLASPVPPPTPAPLIAGGRTDLTTRQLDVLRLISTGMSNKEIARTLRLTEGTVKVHVNAVFRALRVKNRVRAIAAAGLSGLLDTAVCLFMTLAENLPSLTQAMELA